MEQLLEWIKYIIPAGLVLLAVYLVVRAFLNREFEKLALEVRHKNQEIVLPARLQAYERICLFLERISPNNIVVRVRDQNDSAALFQQKLLAEIRNEFNHNLSQQVYMSDKSWTLVKGAMENVVSIINNAASKVDREKGMSIDLAKVIFETMVERNEDPVAHALKHLKMEIQEVF